MREYHKNEGRFIEREFNPGGVPLESDGKRGHRFAFYAKGPNEGYAQNKCAIIHAALSIDNNDNLNWEYLIAEFYNISDVHKEDKELISRPINLIE